jgi:hypothetical protein
MTHCKLGDHLAAERISARNPDSIHPPSQRIHSSGSYGLDGLADHLSGCRVRNGLEISAQGL